MTTKIFRSKNTILKPGWNWPPASAERLAITMESPDDKGDIEVWVVVKRVESDDDED